MRDLEFMWKTDSSAGGECPSLFKTDGGYIGVGKALSATDTAQVRALGEANDSGIGADEVAVFFPADVIDRMRERG